MQSNPFFLWPLLELGPLYLFSTLQASWLLPATFSRFFPWKSFCAWTSLTCDAPSCLPCWADSHWGITAAPLFSQETLSESLGLLSPSLPASFVPGQKCSELQFVLYFYLLSTLGMPKGKNHVCTYIHIHNYWALHPAPSIMPRAEYICCIGGYHPCCKETLFWWLPKHSPLSLIYYYY